MMGKEGLLGHSSFTVVRQASVEPAAASGCCEEDCVPAASSSVCRSLIRCNSSFRYSIASPNMDALSIYAAQSPAHPLHLRQLGTYVQDLGFLMREREKEISFRKTLNLIRQMEGTLNPLMEREREREN